MGRGRITIGLYNSYDQNFREPHRRTIARAGDLAMAFDMNLALFGFPIPEETRTPVEVAEWIAGTTSIGAHGGYFMELAEKGRFMKFPYPDKGFPPQLGEPVLTTSKPDPSKRLDLDGLIGMVERGQSVLLVFGIGPHGVPKKTASIPRYNIDITPGGFSLETCTALGAVCGAISARLARAEQYYLQTYMASSMTTMNAKALAAIGIVILAGAVAAIFLLGDNEAAWPDDDAEYREVGATAFMYSPDADKQSTVTLRYYEDSPSIPYISMREYYDKLQKEKLTAYHEGNGIFTLDNHKKGPAAPPWI